MRSVTKRQALTRAGRASIALLIASAAIVTLAAPPASAGTPPVARLVISEFRLRGPQGARDEFVEIANPTLSDQTVESTSGTGYGLATAGGVLHCTIANGTVIPVGGHFLCAATPTPPVIPTTVPTTFPFPTIPTTFPFPTIPTTFPVPTGPTTIPTTIPVTTEPTVSRVSTATIAPSFSTTPDATYSNEIADNAGIALFSTNVSDDYSLGTRLDAVGSTSESDSLYKEGTGYPALTPFSIDYAWYRNLSTPAIASYEVSDPTPGLPQDTGDNSADFLFVDTNGTSAGGGQRLGAPSPKDLASPVSGSGIGISPIDGCAPATAPPNAVRDLTSNPSGNATFGTVSYRRAITNNTGAALTELRIRVTDIRTFPAPSTWADLRPVTSESTTANVRDITDCLEPATGASVLGTTLENPPAEPNGGGFNSTLAVSSVTALNPLANGATIDVQFLAGIQQTGLDAMRFTVEALPSAGGGTPTVNCASATFADDLTAACTPPDAPPVAVADSYSTSEDSALSVPPLSGVLVNDTDLESDPLTAVLVTGPAHGSLTLGSLGAFIYTPDANYNGADSFTYKANDGTVDGNTVTVSLTVSAVNDAPVAVADSYSPTEDTVLSVPAGTGVLANDTDVDSDTLSAVLVLDVDHGTLALNADGSFTYTPTANYHGSDSFTYKVNDGTVDGNTVTVSLTVGSVNDPPVAVADSYSTNQDTTLSIVAGSGVLANDTDADADPLTATLVAGPAHGSLTLGTLGAFVYIPTTAYHGADSFTYKANDGTVDGNTVTVSLTIVAVDAAPVASADFYRTGEDVALVSSAPGVLGNDTDEEGDTLHAVLGESPSHGVLQLADDGSFTYTPAINFTGDDGFTYTASDGTASSAPISVLLHVVPSAGTDPDQFVTDAYQVLLHRAPDAGGLAFWSARLTHGYPRTAITEWLVHSTESSNLLIVSAYGQILDRQPDQGGLTHWRAFLDGGGTYQELKARLAGSSEFNAGLSDTEFVAAAYHALLGRSADQSGIDGWVARLSAGRSRTKVARGMLVTAEGRRVQLAPLYVLVLLRPMGDPDFAAVGPMLVHGDWRVVAADLVASDEFFALATVDPGVCDGVRRC